jgi:hypothetical protein
VHDLRALLRLGEARTPSPSAVVVDSRTLQSTPESGARAGAGCGRFRRLAKDYERLPATVAGLHFVAFACLMLHRAVALFVGPSQI